MKGMNEVEQTAVNQVRRKALSLQRLLPNVSEALSDTVCSE
jgi:hypothetical protein